VNLAREYGETPLSVASGNGHLDVVKVLLSEGKADANLANRRKAQLTLFQPNLSAQFVHKPITLLLELRLKRNFGITYLGIRLMFISDNGTKVDSPSQSQYTSEESYIKKFTF